jgi:hypothetical protein
MFQNVMSLTVATLLQEWFISSSEEEAQASHHPADESDEPG